jgi:hypothetical protein
MKTGAARNRLFRRRTALGKRFGRKQNTASERVAAKTKKGEQQVLNLLLAFFCFSD